MDILTHAALGVVAAGAFIEWPETAFCILVGSVAPDLDVVSRLFGKRAMLRSHQTASHSIFTLAAAALLIGLTPLGAGAGLGFFSAALLHVLMDYTNTLGVTLLWPVVKSRLHVSWVFFIDAWVMAPSLVAATATVFSILREGGPTEALASATGILLLAYWIWKAALLKRARVLAGPDRVSIVPSAFLPWHFYVCSRTEGHISVDLLNLHAGSKTKVSDIRILDEEVKGTLDPLPEWHLMRSLSPAYHAVSRQSSGTGSIIFCRDLRIRNFQSTYGDLEVHVDASGTVSKTLFHV